MFEVGSPALLRQACRAATAGGEKKRKGPFCRPRRGSVVRRRRAHGISTNVAALNLDKHFPPDTRLIIYGPRAHADIEVWKLK